MCQAVSPCKKLWVFDFDDTLVKTDSRVFRVNADGSRTPLTPHEYVTRMRVEGEAFDYSEFEVLVNPRALEPTHSTFMEAIVACGLDRVAILSARSFAGPIHEYVRLVGAEGVAVAAVASSQPAAKARWLEERLAAGDVSEVVYFDDSLGNIEAAHQLSLRCPHVRFNLNLVAC